MAFPIITQEEARESEREGRREFTKELGVYRLALKHLECGSSPDVCALAQGACDTIIGKWTNEMKSYGHLFKRDQFELRRLETRNRAKLNPSTVEGLVSLEKEISRIQQKIELLTDAFPERIWH